MGYPEVSAPSIASVRGRRYRWYSNMEYILSHAIYVIYQANHYQISGIAVGNHIQFASALVCVLLICLPIQYMQTILGQYGQSSAACLKMMTPIAHGIAYSYLLVSYLRLPREAVLGGDAILYFFNSMQSELPWLECRPENEDTCWFDDKCNSEQPCLNDKVSLSSSQYWNSTFMGFTKNNRYAPDIRRLVTTLLIWTIVYLVIFLTKTFSNRFLRYTFLVSVFLRVIILVPLLLISYFGISGIVFILETSYENLFDIYSWVRQMVAMICYMSVGRGGNILLGSFFAPGYSAGLITVFATTVISGIYIIILESYFVVVRKLAMYANLGEPSMDLLQGIHETIEFTLIPAGLGYTKITQLWSIVYFLAIILHSLCHLILGLRIMSITLEDAFPLLTRYRNYVMATSFLVYIIISIAFVTRELYHYSSTVLNYLLDLFETIITFLFVFIVAWIYGVQKLCDDVHFIVGSQPAKFWKVAWYLNPALIFIGIIFFLLDSKDLYFIGFYETIFIIIVECILISPVLILGIYQMFKYVRQRNFVGVFQMTETWGMANAKERLERKIFNPRKETKSRRRNEKCQHNCLLRSKILSHVLAEEAAWNREDLDADPKINSEHNFDTDDQHQVTEREGSIKIRDTLDK